MSQDNASQTDSFDSVDLPKALFQFNSRKNVVEEKPDRSIHLDEILSNVTQAEVEKLSFATKSKLAFLLGSSAYEEMRSLAKEFHLKESRNLETLSLSPRSILVK